MVEVLVALSVVALLAAVAVPRVLGARDESRHEACLDAFHVFDAALARRLEEITPLDRVAAIATAIDGAISELEQSGRDVNPRRVARLPYERVEGPAFVPPPSSSCTVFAFDATDDGPDATPAIVITHYERGVHSFRIALD